LLVRCLSRAPWTDNYSNWDDNSVFPTSGVYLLPQRASISLTIFFLIVILFGLCLEFRYHLNEIEFKQAGQVVQLMESVQRRKIKANEPVSVGEDLKSPLITNVDCDREWSPSDQSIRAVVFERLTSAFNVAYSFGTSVWVLRLLLIMFCVFIIIYVFVSAFTSTETYYPFAVAIVCIVWFDPFAYKKLSIISYVLPR
jgi:hypothetical protein